MTPPAIGGPTEGGTHWTIVHGTVIEVTSELLCLTLLLELCNQGQFEPYLGQTTPGNIAPRVVRPLKPLHHSKVAVV